MVFMGTKIGQCQEFSTILVNTIVNFNNLTHFGDNFGGRAHQRGLLFRIYLHLNWQYSLNKKQIINSIESRSNSLWLGPDVSRANSREILPRVDPCNDQIATDAGRNCLTRALLVSEVKRTTWRDGDVSFLILNLYASGSRPCVGSQ